MSLSKVVPSIHYKTYPQHLGNYFSLQRILLYIENWINKLVSPKFNPFYFLGAISILFFIILFISGLYLFIFYRTNNPYQIVQDLTEKQWYLGGIMRSAHRYSSDGLMFSLILHTIREFLYGRYSSHRWLAWISGIILFFITLIIGIIGYWLVWDERAQLIALKTSELLNDIPLFIEPLPRSFLSNESLNAMLFFLLHLIHLGIPLLIIILIGVHIMRCSRPVLNPPRSITIGILIMILVISIFFPAKSALPADLNILPIDTPFDWFYFFIYPAMTIIPKPLFWSITMGLTIILFIMPWIKRDRSPIAQVELKNCIGCDQCNKDCPYGAIKLQPRTDGLPFKTDAVVIPKRCASCGICVGACDFNAINLPGMTDIQIKEEIVELLSDIQQTDIRPRILLLICEHSIKFGSIVDIRSGSFKGMSNVKVIAFPCIGMVQPSMIEAGLESGADGIFISGCMIGDCNYRKGNLWLRARLRDQRPPSLNRTFDRQRIKEYWLSSININTLREEILLFEGDINKHKSGNKYPRFIKPDGEIKGISKRKMLFSSIILFLLPTLFIPFLSMKPSYPFYSKDRSLIKITFKHSGKQECRELTEKDTMNELKHMRKTNSPFSKIRMDCDRKRLPVYVEVDLDNKNILSRTYYPTGMRKDGSTFAYEEIHTAPGTHEIKVKMRDSKEESPFNYIFEKKTETKKGRVAVIDLSSHFNVK